MAIALALGALALATGCSDTDRIVPGALTVEDVLDRHIAAIGGEQAIESVRNIRLTVEVVEPEFTVSGVYRATTDHVMRVDIYMQDQRVFSEGVDAAGSWQQAGEGAEVTGTNHQARAALDHGIEFNLFGLHDLTERGHQATLFGRELIGEVDYYVIQVTLADGFERHYYINPDNWLIERHRETSALHPDLDTEERPAETLVSDNQERCGILQATRSQKVDLETGDEVQRTRTLDQTCNADPGSLNIDRTSAALTVAG
jgi:hypothetical protein